MKGQGTGWPGRLCLRQGHRGHDPEDAHRFDPVPVEELVQRISRERIPWLAHLLVLQPHMDGKAL